MPWFSSPDTGLVTSDEDADAEREVAQNCEAVGDADGAYYHAQGADHRTEYLARYGSEEERASSTYGDGEYIIPPWNGELDEDGDPV